jgi:hypothetical protein
MTGSGAQFPAQLQDWAGNRAGGVRRLFDENSGRPGGLVFQTNLLLRLQAWSEAIANNIQGSPRILLLVGGPGNGKTEAIESTVKWLDEAVGLEGALISGLKTSFFPPPGQAVPRLVNVEAAAKGRPSGSILLSIVQDASAVVGDRRKDAASLLLEELESALGDGSAYLCCVNRGVLDDALIAAIDARNDKLRRLLESVSRAVSLSPGAPACWPLSEFTEVAVWPMDAESLLERPSDGQDPPAEKLLLAAILEDKWPIEGSCPAGSFCPFCASRGLLAKERARSSLLRMLRFYEVGSGKRWSFRDLFSLVSYLLAGHRPLAKDAALEPCEWANQLAKRHADARAGAPVAKDRSTAIFQLVAAQYHHALFHRWNAPPGLGLLREIRELQLTDDNTAMGLHWFLVTRRSSYLPTMISGSLDSFVDLLDPALADPDVEVTLSSQTSFPLRELDVRFSRSITEGLNFARKYRVLTKLDVELLERLAKLDAELSIAGVRRRRPAAATTVQRYIRDFACRLVRRSICSRVGAVREEAILAEFQRIIEAGSGQDLDDVAQEVERLLNRDRDFEVSLTTTFGQPLPPDAKRATLVVPAKTVSPLDEQVTGRPKQPIQYLRAGDGRKGQPIALTYELFRAVKELELGMSVASLPRTVVALLDTTRARLAGPIVRDQDALDRARIRIGAGDLTIAKRRSGFALTREGRGR